jgi:hypothetical protein
VLNLANPRDGYVQCGSHLAMHAHRVAAGDEDGLPSAAAQ